MMSMKKLQMIQSNRDSVIADYNSKEKENLRFFNKGNPKYSKEYIYPNQKYDASEIIKLSYENPKIRAFSIIKRTKVGMDGLMIELAKIWASHPDNEQIIDPDNIFFITGMSNKEWEEAMKEKIPNCFKNNVFHHGKLKNFKNKLDERIDKLRNGIIFIDEIDNGDKQDQNLDKILVEKILDINYLDQHNVKLVFVSATIVKELNDLVKWGDRHLNYKMTIPDNYCGHGDFLHKGIIQEFYAVNDQVSAEKWINEDVIAKYGNDYRVHIIRTTESNKHFIEVVCNKNGLIFKNHTSDDKLTTEELGKIFSNVNNHIIIAIKGLLRRANLIPDDWKLKIGAIHERYCKSPDTNVQIQGLVGRLTGYWKDKIDNDHKTGPYRTSIKSIKEYENFFENPSIKQDYHTTGNKKLFTEPKHIKNLEIKEEITEEIEENKRLPVIIKLDKNNPIFKMKSTSEIDRNSFINYIITSIFNNNPIYQKLSNFIMNRELVHIKQITRPTSENSYKKHITDAVNSFNTNKGFSIDLKPNDKTRNNWQLYIDLKEYRLLFIIWSLDKNLY